MHACSRRPTDYLATAFGGSFLEQEQTNAAERLKALPTPAADRRAW